MRVFVVGGTGVLGGAVLPRLVRDGHEVVALARSDASVERLEAGGVEAVQADLFDRGSLEEAMRGADAALQLATAIPASMRVRFRGAWAENDRLRAEGTRNVVDAALASGVGTVVYPGYFAVYADGGDAWIDASSGALDAPWFLASSLEAEGHVARFAEQGGRGVSLRMASFYGVESPQTVELISYARRGFLPLPGAGDAYLPSIWVQDAGEAVVAALDAPSGVYDVADDEPLTREEYAQAVASAVGRKRVRRPPMWFARLASGSVASALGRSQRVSNRHFREATGWAPEVSSAREGWARLAAA